MLSVTLGGNAITHSI